MADKIRVGVLFGGQSGEHEVSLVSARAVIDALDTSKYDVVPIGITKQGRWIAGDNAMPALEAMADPEALAGWLSGKNRERAPQGQPRTESLVTLWFSGRSKRSQYGFSVLGSRFYRCGLPSAARPHGRGWHGPGPAGARGRAVCRLRRAGLGGGDG